MHVFNVLQIKLGSIFCSCVELFILVELQQIITGRRSFMSLLLLASLHS